MRNYAKLLALLFMSLAGSMYAQDDGSLVVLGNKEMNDGNYREAQNYYQAAIAREPRNWNLYTLMGFCYHKQRLYLMADSFYRISIKNDSTPSKPYWYKGLNHLTLRQDSLAIVNFKKFISIEKKGNGSLIQAYRYTGQSYERILRKDGLYSWQIDDMLYHYEQIERTDPSYVEVPLIRNFIEQVKSKRPAAQTGKWKLESRL
jgi:tetratricopeptide (TPR) repeat protein